MPDLVRDLLRALAGAVPMLCCPSILARELAALRAVGFGRLAEIAAHEMAAAAPGSRGLPLDLIEDVAVVRLRGFMMPGGGGLLGAMMGASDTHAARRAVEAAAASTDARGILLVVDSPGGHVGGVPELGDAIFEARSRKPTWAMVEGMAASAAYWAASQAHRIVATRTSEVGSIGVYTVVDDQSRRYENEGITTHVISSGPLKGQGVEGAPISSEYLAEAQRLVDGLMAEFLGAVSRGRGTPQSGLASVATGGVWLGSEAVGLRLVDEIGTFRQTLDALQREVGGGKRSRRARAAIATLQLNPY